ncbi:prepilin-type N-terminal cleavage/methylation domain-containing protein [Parasalinivibrio latis]|uniref:PilW family protein n=1 Tax=Parasalinivibrio latis TaxID=2952610 RepID=UPI0030E31162
MDMTSVKPVAVRQSGFTLIEMMVSSAVGILVLMTVSTVYLKGQDLAFGRAHQLAITQDAFDALRMIKEEIQRAGYSPSGSSLRLLGSSNIVEINSDGNCVALVYQSPGSSEFQHSAFYLNPTQEKLVYRSKKEPSVLAFSTLCDGTGGEQLLDLNLYKVKDFTVSAASLVGPSAQSGFYTIQLGIEPKSGTDVCKYGKSNICEYSLSVKPRNWKS